jgi:hypothetical protein
MQDILGWIYHLSLNNCVAGTEGNFKKLSNSSIMDYGVEYDYSSIMHYSRKAFSKNGKDTIVPLVSGF